MIRNWKHAGVALCALGVGFGAALAQADEISVGTDAQTSIAVTISVIAG